jgi:hypothetical protein
VADSFSGGGGGGSGGGVSSFTGDGTILSNSASTGAVTATLESAPAYTGLVNDTASSATPTYNFVPIGSQVLSTATTLTASSPTYIIAPAATTLPVASTCIGKSFWIYAQTLGSGFVLTCQGSDKIFTANSPSGVASYTITNGASIQVMAVASGQWYVITPPSVYVNNINLEPAVGALYIVASSNTGTAAVIPPGTGVLFGNGATPAYTLTPGSTTALTSITADHHIGAGTAPTIAAGAGAGSSPTVGITTGTDASGLISILTGTLPSASAVVATITFHTSYGATPNAVSLTPANANANGLLLTGPVWADSGGLSATQFTLNVGSVALSAATTYLFYYQIIA